MHKNSSAQTEESCRQQSHVAQSSRILTVFQRHLFLMSLSQSSSSTLMVQEQLLRIAGKYQTAWHHIPVDSRTVHSDHTLSDSVSPHCPQVPCSVFTLLSLILTTVLQYASILTL
jgi:hypothetical protein